MIFIGRSIYFTAFTYF